MDQETLKHLVSTSFLHFVKFMNPEYVLTPFHRKLIAQLQRVVDGELYRLALSVPPGHGKSELCSRLLPLFMTLRNPKGKTLAASYSSDFSRTEFGEPIRNMYLRKKDKLRIIFPDAEIDMSSRSGNMIKTTSGGHMVLAGWNGGFTGRRATNIFLIDDVIKNAQEAQSRVILDGLYKWFYTVAMTRLLPAETTPMVMLATRWSENDLIGRVAQGNPEWEYINIPCIANEEDPANDFIGRKKGEILWEERFSRSFLESQMKDAYSFAALYQGNPVVETGNLIKDYYFETYETLPSVDDQTRRYKFSTWDTAAKSGQENDYSVRIDWELRVDSVGTLSLYILDLYRAKPDINDLFDEARNAWRRGFAPVIEEGSSGVQLVQLLAQEGHESGIVRVSPQGNKIEKLNKVLTYFNESRIYLPKDAPWLPNFRGELKAFPYGKHDDQVDAVRLALQVVSLQRRELFVASKRKMGKANIGGGHVFPHDTGRKPYGVPSHTGIAFDRLSRHDRGKFGVV